MLQFENVSRTFSGPDAQIAALTDVSLTIEGGEFVVVRGPSGSGKSTLLLTGGGLLRPSCGRVLVEGKDPYSLDAATRSRLRAERIGFVFQQFHLLPYLSVYENVLVPSAALPSTGARKRARELIAQFGLGDRANHLPAQLSTGEKQRAALARALLNRPGLLLADEPTGNLDEASGHAVLNALEEFVSQGGAVLMVTHETSLTCPSACRAVRLERGRLQP